MEAEVDIGGFSFDLIKPSLRFIESVGLPNDHPLISWFQRKPRQKSELLEILCDLIGTPKTCKQLAKFCTPVLLELVKRAVEKCTKGRNDQRTHNLELASALTSLVIEYPYLYETYREYILDQKEILLDKSIVLKDDQTLLMSLEISYHLLRKDSKLFSSHVNWDVILKALGSNSREQASYAFGCLLILANYNDWSSQTDQISKDFGNFRAKPEVDLSNKDMPHFAAQLRKNESIDFISSDLQTNLRAMCNILVPVTNNGMKHGTSRNKFVMTSNASTALHGMILSWTTGTPFLLEGELGTGKTALVEYFAEMIGHLQAPDVLKLQLGEQTDSKSILGMHVCTESPGEFKWQPGTLTQAVQNGSWLILEDIDSAPADVISVLIPLMESRSLIIPGQGKTITAASGFQIFLTRRIQRGAGGRFHQNAPSSAIEHLCSVVQLEPLTQDDLTHIANRKHEHLEKIVEKLVDVYSMVSSDLHLETAQDTRLANLPTDKRFSTSRDFFKWCQRIADGTYHSSLVSINSDVFQEAYSCFCVPVNNLGDRVVLAQAIGSKLGLSKDKIDFYIFRYKPQVQQTKLTFGVGRVTLPRHQQFVGKIATLSSSKYAFTRHSLNLLEQIAICVSHNEPVLLVGETGCGKTATIQYLAMQCGHKFSAINMSQQSDVTDLLGGFKPVDFKQIVEPAREKFDWLFRKTFSEKQNVKFLGHIQECWAQKKWKVLLKLMQHCKKSAMQRKAIKSDSSNSESLMNQWKSFGAEVKKLQKQLDEEQQSLVFMFVEGKLIKAIQNGEWILLDEINLATAETLECLSGLLESKVGSIVLVERGDAEPIRRHENFRLFACMNPATDVGKKDLPFGIRNRFSEIYVDELNDEADLKVLVAHYLEDADVTSPLVDGIVEFYQLVQREAKEKLRDGTGHKPHYSLRTLCRALEYSRNSPMMFNRAVYEGFCLSFLTQLDRSSHPRVEKMIQKHIFGHLTNISSVLSQPIPNPGKSGQFCNIEGYWIEKGNLPAHAPNEYVLTASVKENLRDLARVVSGRNYPVLLQGETSVGKTSLINYLAKSTGNQCVRINNHEHTDIQEYIGCYAADSNGRLIFKDGLLVDAMKKGYWIILDELNLAPTDVLEALNRLLDDNRELFIAETQEVVKAHSKFMLFATQNPPGQYGGRKILSRAFRNRFVELHFDEIPSKELEIILHKRCHLPQSYCKKFVAVLHELQTRRKQSGIFAGKHGFITLRDLFRWAERYRLAPQSTAESRFYDWDQHIAEDGYMLLAGRCRKAEEAIVIQETIEKVMRRKINLESLFGNGSLTTSGLLRELDMLQSKEFKHLVWTSNLRRMAVLIGRAIQFNEPVLLVGETGCGKTTICQVFAHLRNTKLYSINCHMHTESSDFIGGLRPVRQRENEKDMKLFEWCDGPLVSAMLDGSSILIDEISLADDSVLERINSVLETEKTLVLAEKGGSDNSSEEEIEIIVAHDKFRLMATMNPGGDFGKKELSPALRNRFTEVWCSQSESREDFIQIINHNVYVQDDVNYGALMMDFIEWFKETEAGQRAVISIRDLLCWVDFVNKATSEQHICGNEDATNQLTPKLAYIHGAFLVFIDSIGSGSTWSGPSFSLQPARDSCWSFLETQTNFQGKPMHHGIIWNNPNYFGITPFVVGRGPLPHQSAGTYSLTTPTTFENALRLLRALQLSRPILLEGSPGVGKTSLVTAIAKLSGHELVRINLSEQTDVTDLFGADLPVEGGHGGEFAWRDGPFLKALKAGHWIVMDELNLASQSVLEGLNACFDHRAQIFVPELAKTFEVDHENTRIFACQNPLSQGGGRKGLPKSFLNRFTKVFIDSLKDEDLQFIVTASFPDFDQNILTRMIHFNTELQRKTMIFGEWGRKGSPWEFNIRDVLRWCELINKHQKLQIIDPSEFLSLIYEDRMRTTEDKKKVVDLYKQVFEDENFSIKLLNRRMQMSIGISHIQIGHSISPRNYIKNKNQNSSRNELQLLRQQIPIIESVMKCIEMNWLAILIGPKASGKTSIVESVAYLTGNTLNTLAMNSNMDTTELLGGFEQVNLSRHLESVLQKAEDSVGDMLAYFIKEDAHLKNAESLDQILQMKMKLRNLNETYQKLAAKSDEDSFTITRIFEELAEILVTIESKDLLTEKFGKVKKQFEQLKRRFEEEGRSLHAKGQFEWVDGALVDALKDGEWLLVDNVNFCSPSVLDRLNGLLEPNGTLSIDERGVQNGEIPCVKPHPNFRLFFAMDPKHGEISRAMRNRGIEIYVAGKEEDAMFEIGDLMQLISSVGLKQVDLNKPLIEIFYELCSLETKVSAADLVRAAKLIKEMISRGFNKREAIEHGCIQSFASSEIRPEIRERITERIKSFVCEHFECDEISDDAAENSKESLLSTQGNLITNSILPSVQEYSQWSLSAVIKRDSSFIFKSILDYGDENTHKLAMKCFIERSSVSDWKQRIDFLVTQRERFCVASGFIDQFCKALNELFKSNVFSIISRHLAEADCSIGNFQILQSCAYDLSLNKSLLNRCLLQADKNERLANNLDSISSLCNRMKLLLERTFQILGEQQIANENIRTSKKTFLGMSVNTNAGKLSKSSLPHSVVHLLHPCVTVMDEVINQTLQSTERMLTDDECSKLMFALKWRDRFVKLCMSAQSETLMQMQFPKALFSLHWNWITDELIPLIKSQTIDCRKGLFEEFSRIIEAMSSNLAHHLQTNWQLPEAFSSLYLHPSPFKSLHIFETWTRLKTLEDSLSLIKQLQIENEGDNLSSLNICNFVKKSQQLIDGFKLTQILSVKDHVSDEDKSGLETLMDHITRESDDAFQTANNGECDRSAFMSPTFYPLFGCIELLAWLSFIHTFKRMKDTTGITSNEKEIVSKDAMSCIDKLSQFPLLTYSGNCEAISKLLLTKQHIENDQAFEAGKQTVCLLRFHCHELARFKVHRIFTNILFENPQEGRNCNLEENEGMLSPFSSITANVVHPFLSGKLSAYKPTDGRLLNDVFEWKVKLLDVHDTRKAIAMLKDFYWRHEGLIQRLPHQLWSHLFADNIDMLEGIINLVMPQEGISVDMSRADDINDFSYLNTLRSLNQSLTSKNLEKSNAPREMKEILQTINNLVAEEVKYLTQEVAGEDSVKLMSKVLLNGILSTSIGMLGFFLGLPKMPYDLIEEAQVECRHFQHELQEIEKELKFRYDVEAFLSGTPTIDLIEDQEVTVKHHTSNASRVCVLLKRKEYLYTEIKELRKRLGLRPDPSKYDSLLKDLSHFYENIASPQVIMAMINESYRMACCHRVEVDGSNLITSCSNLKQKINAWNTSTGHFINQLDTNYPLYPDIIIPLKHSLTQIMHGLSFVLSVLEWIKATRGHNSIVKKSTVEKLSISRLTRFLGSFPVAENGEILLPIDLAKMFMSTPFISLLNELISRNTTLTMGMRPRILQLALLNITNDVILTKGLKDHSKAIVMEILNEFNKIWLKFSEDERIREEEQSSIYRFKSKSHCQDSNDEEMNEKQFKELFPTFHSEFDDLIPKQSLDDHARPNEEAPNEEWSTTISDDMKALDICFIFESVKSLFDYSSEILDEKIIHSFLRCQRETMVLSSLTESRLDPLLDSNLASSNLLFMKLLDRDTSKQNSLETPKGAFDIYHDNNIAEAEKLIELLDGFLSRVTELLEEFHEHPGLMQIKQIIERILSFPVNQPLMKFLTGLEILLKQSQDWETYASSRVSISSHLQLVTGQIIEWRKLELRCWPHLLKVVEKKLNKQAQEWFLKLYSVLVEFLNQSDADGKQLNGIAKLLQEFLENSTIGEFSARLDVIITLSNLMKEKSQALATVLWNIYHYYNQFTVNLNEHIARMKSPIEKDLKDYVKIAKWKDVNFWAMKQAAEKSHRTLHKFIRNYESFQSAPVVDHLKIGINQQAQSNKDENSKHGKFLLKDIGHFCSSTDAALSLANIINKDDWSKNCSELSVKMIRKCWKYLKHAKHSSMIQSLDHFTGDVIENVKELQALDITKLAEEKRSEARKHLHARKRTALATLFKTLKGIGLSYRKGLSTALQQDGDEKILSPIIELERSSEESGQLLQLSEDCHAYYFKCLARYSALQNALRDPSKELTSQDVARCRGLSEHLLFVANEQRKYLRDLLNSYNNIRCKVDVFGKIFNSMNSKGTRSLLPWQKNTFHWLVKLKNLFDLTVYVMKQFGLLIKCCPNDRTASVSSPIVDERLPRVNSSSLNDELLKRIRNLVEHILATSKSLKAKFDKLVPNDALSFIATWSHVECIQDAVRCFEDNIESYNEIEKSFTCPGIDPSHSLASSVSMLKNQTTKTLIEFQNSSFQSNEPLEEHCASGLTEATEHLFKSILVSVQDIVKLTNEKADQKKKEDNDITEGTSQEGDEDLELAENLLLPRLGKDFYNEIKLLRSSAVTLRLQVFMQETRELYDVSMADGCDILLLYPAVEQYLRFLKYFLERLFYLHRTSCKLLSVLTGIFSELLINGFCLPSGETEAAGEGATEFEDIKGGGIGEGEGVKDVSDQIESEDQLQDAKHEGQESQRTEDEEDVPEEEQGIEMSDDFEGRMHDEDPNADREEPSEESSDEETDLDDKMGDLDGMNEETLDEKFWEASDDEDDKEKEDKEDEKGKGADGKSKSELVAKDENKDEQQGKEGNNQQDIEDTDHINELQLEEEEEKKEMDDGNENDEGKKPEELNDEFPADLNLDKDGESDEESAGSDLEDDFQENEKAEDGIEESIEREQKDEQTEDESNENDDGVNNEKVDDPEQEGDQPKLENQEDIERAKEDLSEQAENQTQSQPSDAETIATANANVKTSDVATGAQDMVEESQQERNDKETGSSQQRGNEGHDGISSMSQRSDNNGTQDEKRNQRKDYNRSRQDRTLAVDTEKKAKRLKTLDAGNTSNDTNEDQESSDIYQHVHEDEHFDAHAFDAATAAQVLDQADKKESFEQSDEGEMDVDDIEADQEINDINEEKLSQTKTSSKMENPRPSEEPCKMDNEEDDIDNEMTDNEDLTVENEKMQVEIKSGFYTSKSSLISALGTKRDEVDQEIARKELEQQLATWSIAKTDTRQDNKIAIETWRKYESLTSSVSQQLCEQLRLVLEPTLASKLKGDYRTGKRLNMRKVIPYIASQFRKDKIWLRRTKKSRRQYQVMLAVDDSSSMGDNHSKQLAFESLAVISNALTWLEAGELAVLSFGEATQLLHSFKEPFNEQAGAHVLKNFTFQQKKTNIAQMLNMCSTFMMQETSLASKRSYNRMDTSQLLLIVSDGRGIFLEGKEVVERSVRHAREAGIFIVFIILDNPSNRDSILDIRVPVFKSDGKVPEIKSYIEEFPFPFYLILRDINSLPNVLSDALRQWFELVTSMT